MNPKRWSLRSGRGNEMALLMSRRILSFCGERGEKPIALRARKFCYQGPGTWSKNSPRSEGERRFPIQIEASSDLNSKYGFGAVQHAGPEVNANIIKHLFDICSKPTLAGAVH